MTASGKHQVSRETSPRALATKRRAASLKGWRTRKQMKAAKAAQEFRQNGFRPLTWASTA